MNKTKITQLQGLEKKGYLLFHWNERSQSAMERRKRQLPLTPAYSFTDYRSQGQTIQNIIIDIGNPPSGTLMPFNIYVALSRARGRNQIQLLRDFDDKLLTKHPSEYLRLEDERLGDLETKTDERWQRILSELSE